MIHKLISSQYKIEKSRLKELNNLAAIISQQLAEKGKANLLFVCTHNSRRSQLAEFWMQYLLTRKSLSQIECYSAGTEATAFNYRMIDALQRFGVSIDKKGSDENPDYYIEDVRDRSFHSKTVDDKNIPKEHLIAIMVCDHADQNCPFIPGADHRFSLRYVDPKERDNSNKEQKGYDDKIIEIGLELHYISELLAELIENKN